MTRPDRCRITDRRWTPRGWRHDQLDANGVGYRREYDGDLIFLGCRLHRHCDGSGYAYHQVDVLSDEVCDDLVHDVSVCVAVFAEDLKLDVVFFAELVQSALYIVDDLVERGVVYIVADAYLEGFLCGFGVRTRVARACGHNGRDHKYGQ